MNATQTQARAAELASAVAGSVQYQGRKAIRRGSEYRRQAILDAAMRIIVRDGVRAVRHRAVAAEAGVPLSATTYYFKDINDLISDTFAQYVERSAVSRVEFWQQALERLLPTGERLAMQSWESLLEQSAAVLVDYVLGRLHNCRDELLADQVLREEALRNPHLVDMVLAHQQILNRAIIHLFELLGSILSPRDVQLLTAIITQMEYQGLLLGVERLEVGGMQAALTHYMHLILVVSTADDSKRA